MKKIFIVFMVILLLGLTIFPSFAFGEDLDPYNRDLLVLNQTRNYETLSPVTLLSAGTLAVEDGNILYYKSTGSQYTSGFYFDVNCSLNHYYLASYSITFNSTSTVNIGFLYRYFQSYTESSGTVEKSILVKPTDRLNFGFFQANSASVCDMYLNYCSIIDLTVFYGDNDSIPSTVDEIKADLSKYGVDPFDVDKTETRVHLPSDFSPYLTFVGSLFSSFNYFEHFIDSGFYFPFIFSAAILGIIVVVFVVVFFFKRLRG